MFKKKPIVMGQFIDRNWHRSFAHGLTKDELICLGLNFINLSRNKDGTLLSVKARGFDEWTSISHNSTDDVMSQWKRMERFGQITRFERQILD